MKPHHNREARAAAVASGDLPVADTPGQHCAICGRLMLVKRAMPLCFACEVIADALTEMSREHREDTARPHDVQ